METRRSDPIDLVENVYRARLVLFTRDHPQHEGRRARRARIFELRPIDPTEQELLCTLIQPVPGGAHWEYLLPDDSTLLVRSEDTVTLHQAERDADRQFAPKSPLRVVFVRDRDNGQLSWWIANRGEVVFMAPRLWLPSQRRAVAQSARRGVAVLGKPAPPWGKYSG